MDRMGGASVIAFVVLLSFAIDRAVTGILFALSWSPRWRAICPDPAEFTEPSQKAAAARAQKTAYFILAGTFSLFVFFMEGTGILAQLGLSGRPFDSLLTAIILIGGAERVSEFSKAMGSGNSPATAIADPPVRITGTLSLEEGTIQRLRGHDSAKIA
jgi:hypothetical protein